MAHGHKRKRRWRDGQTILMDENGQMKVKKYLVMAVGIKGKNVPQTFTNYIGEEASKKEAELLANAVRSSQAFKDARQWVAKLSIHVVPVYEVEEN